MVTDWKAAFKDFATPIVNIQNAPTTPDPGAGLSGLNELLGKSGVFNDITGLQGNQQNAIRTYLSNNENAKAFAEMAKGLAMQQHNTENSDTITNSLNQARESGAISDTQHQRLTEQHLEQQIDGGESRREQARTEREAARTSLSDVAAEAAQEGRNVSAQRTDTDGNTESLVIGDTSPEVNPYTIDIANNTSDLRAFHPTANDKTGEIQLQAVSSGIAAPSYRWENVGSINNVSFSNVASAATTVRALVPGIHRVRIVVSDGATMRPVTRSREFVLSVPQFVRITENAAEFDAVLTRYQVLHLKNAIIQEMKRVCDHVLTTSNVRTIWEIGSFRESVPAFIPATSVTVVTLRDQAGSSATMSGHADPNHTGWGPSVYNEQVEVYPGAFINTIGNNYYEFDTLTRALVTDLTSANTSDPAIEAFAIKFLGRLTGHTMAHEILHTLLGLISTSPGNAHNPTDVAGDIMNSGGGGLTERTGLVDHGYSSPVDPAHFTDNGIAAISRLQSANQARMDGLFPVRP